MAVFHPQTVKCSCGNTLSVPLADSVNVKRSPASRDLILRGEFHRVMCPACKRQFTVERPFYYTDLNRNAFFRVYPRGERHLWRSASKHLDAAAGLFPESLSGAGPRTLRVVFGMDELREKLVAQDAGIDDRLVELLKAFLVSDHPVLLRRARLRLTLDAVTDEACEFVANYEHNPQSFRVSMPAEIVKNIASKPDEIKAWVKKAHPHGSIFELPDHWVNMWRWSPQPTALEQLKAYAEQVQQGQQIDTSTPAFQQMLDQLPRGTHLPEWAKQALRSLFEFAKTNNLQTLEDKLFEIRFRVELEDDWSANNDPDDIDTLWKLLKDLPDSNVEGNTKLHEILLDAGGGGMYYPNTFDIHIGSAELGSGERFEDLVRHEVGHAVHETKPAVIDGWLESRFGWTVFGMSDGEIDQWVNLMGGWGDLTATEQSEVRQYLLTALGEGSSWYPGPKPAPPAGHPWYREDFGPRLAFEKTFNYWYLTNSEWHRANGKAFFLNYWYQTFLAVDETTLNLVAQMPDSYASMSQFEFFAELYALYYDLDDPKRSVIPADVATWMETNIGAPEPGAPMPAAPREKRAWETIARPDQASKEDG